MKAATIHDLKRELAELPAKEVLDLCIRLAKYKKENKELLTYLLFEAHDVQAYIENVKSEIDDQFTVLPSSNLYLAKKSLRKTLRMITRYSRHTGSVQSEMDMRIYFCKKLSDSGILKRTSVAISNLYLQQLKKINTLADSLHEDLRYDYKKQLDELV